MRIIIFLILIVFCCAFIAFRWHHTLKGLGEIRQQGEASDASLSGRLLGLLWLCNAIGLALSSVYFYDRDISPFFWLMIAVAVNGLGILALQEFFPKLKHRH